MDLNTPQKVRHWFLTRKRGALVAAAAEAKKAGFDAAPIKDKTSEDGRPFFILVVSKLTTLSDLKAVFAASRAAQVIAKRHSLESDGWDVE